MSEPARIVVGAVERPLRQRLCTLLAGITCCDLIETVTGADTLTAALERIPDLVVLSVTLTGLDGLAVCHNLRGTTGLLDLPIMLLGSATSSHQKYQAFYVGATDFMGLPLDTEEFVLRARVHLRAYFRRLSAPRIIHGFDLVMDENNLSVNISNGLTATLTPSEFAILRQLIEANGQPVSTEVLLQEALRKPAGLSSPQLIHTHVRNLRKKLEETPDSPQRLIRNPTGYCVRKA